MPGARVDIAEIRAAGGLKPWLERQKAELVRPVLKQVPKRPKPAKGTPNQTEQRYRDEFLVPRILSGGIAECIFEGRTFELAHQCTYTPDWYVIRSDGEIECHEVKGWHIWEDARVKLKVAARLNPCIKFFLSQLKNNAWKVKIVPS